MRRSIALRPTVAIRPMSARPFSSTPMLAAKTVKPHLLPTDLIPEYPYGPRHIYKQSNRGLYGQTRIQFGNNIAPKWKTKTQRFWRPNIQTHSYWSPSIGATIKTRVSTRVMKTIKKEGGLEEYVLKNKAQRIKELGPSGWNLRWLLMQTRRVQERFNEEREKLGLDKKEVVDNDQIIQYALDVATPGPLSMKSQATLDMLRAAGINGSVFILGSDSMEDMLEATEEGSEEEEDPFRLIQVKEEKEDSSKI